MRVAVAQLGTRMQLAENPGGCRAPGSVLQRQLPGVRVTDAFSGACGAVPTATARRRYLCTLRALGMPSLSILPLARARSSRVHCQRASAQDAPLLCKVPQTPTHSSAVTRRGF